MADKKERAMQAVDKVKGPTPPPRRPIGNVAASIHRQNRATKQPAEVKDEFDYDTAVHMAFLGAGQGGSRIAQAFWALGYRRVGVFNTTDSDFAGLDDELPKLSLDIGGAAKDMRFAREAMQGREEEVWDLMQRSWGTTFDCALICVGLGGGSGSGSALPLVLQARKYMETNNRPPRVGALVSLPSVDEGQQVARNAVNAFDELLKAKVSPLIVIDNDRVHALYTPPMSKLLPTSNNLISQLFHLFNQLAATRSEHITFDRSEFVQLLDSGIIVMGSADIEADSINSPADVSSRIRDELTQSVLAEVNLRSGRKAACLFVASNDVLDRFSKDYFAAGFTQLNRLVGKDDQDTVVHRGLYPGESPGLQCYTLVAELEPPFAKLQALSKVAGIRASGGAASGAKHLDVD